METTKTNMCAYPFRDRKTIGSAVFSFSMFTQGERLGTLATDMGLNNLNSETNQNMFGAQELHSMI